RLATAGAGVAAATLKPGQQPARPKDYQVTVWSLDDARPIVRFRVPGSSFAGTLTFTPDGQMVVTAAHESPLQFWDAKTGAAIGTAELPTRPARVAFDSAGKRLAIAFSDTTAVIFDLAAVLKPAKNGGGP